MKRKNKTLVYALFMLFALLVMIEQIPSVEARSPRPPPQKIRYRVYGYAKDSTTHAAISGATVKIYEGATHIGSTTTSATGYFNYYYYGYSIVSSFKVKISKTGYATATKSASVFDTRCDIGTVYLYFVLPTYDNTVVGYVKDAATEFDVPKTTVKVYTGASYLGLANTNEINGDFTFSYTSQQPILSFTVKVSQVYYDEKTKTCTGAGPIFDMEDIELTRQYLSEVIAYNDFDYDELPYAELWSLDPSSSDYTTTCADGVAYVGEVPNSPEGTEAFVYGSLDLNSWIGNGDLQFSAIVRVSAQSAYQPLNLHMGIKNQVGIPMWEYTDSWSGITDTGWMLITEIVPKTLLFQEGGSYRFYWGFVDNTDANLWKKVEISRIEVVGNKYPEGVLENNLAGVATHPSHDVYDVNPAHDPDTICTAYASSISGTNSLGIGTDASPKIQSAIMISIDNDTYVETGVGYRMTEYNQVDSVCISVEILDLADMSGVNIMTIRDIALNVEGDDAPLPNDIIDEELFTLLLEDIGLVPGLGPHIKFGGHVWHYGFTIGEYRGENHLTRSISNGKASITLDFRDSYISGASTLPGAGSTDYKMQVQIYLGLSTNGGVYRITVRYAVVLENVEVVTTTYGGAITTVTTETFYETKEYTEVFDYAFFPYSDVHIVECDGTFEDDPFTITASGSTDSYSTVNGEGWYFMIGENMQVTVPEIYGGKGLYRMDIDYWEKGKIRLKPLTFYQTQYSWTLESRHPYYRFRAIYTSISNWTRRYAQPTFPFIIHDS